MNTNKFLCYSFLILTALFTNLYGNENIGNYRFLGLIGYFLLGYFWNREVLKY
jgi:hypothetical protein